VTKRKNKFIFYFLILLIIYGIYCAVIIGKNWDSFFFIGIGKDRLSYLLSLGQNSLNDHFVAKMYPGIYNTLSAFFLNIFPKSFELEGYHLINFTTSFFASVGLYKLTKEILNRECAIFAFFIFFLNPIYFGHMAINDRDTVVVFSNIWITYYVFKYLNFKLNKNKQYVYYISCLLALGLGVRFAFVATLLPIFIYALFILYKNKKKINFRYIVSDFIKVLFISIVIILLFWAPVHINLITEPINLINLSFQHGWGYPFTFFNGIIYESGKIPISYIFISLFFKIPEYILFLYLIFIIFFKDIKIFVSKFIDNFTNKVVFIFLNIFIPSALLIFNPFAIYDGLRLFLFVLPYVSIIAAITIFYLKNNLKNKINKSIFIVNGVLGIYFLIFFIGLTPYHYTYVNSLSGKYSNANNRFENDYWGTSLKELIKKTKKNKYFLSKKIIKLNVCGVSASTVKYYIKENNIENIIIVNENNEPEYVILTNRVPLSYNKNIDNKKHTCFNKYRGENILSVKRNGLILSSIKKIED